MKSWLQDFWWVIPTAFIVLLLFGCFIAWFFSPLLTYGADCWNASSPACFARQVDKCLETEHFTADECYEIVILQASDELQYRYYYKLIP